MTESRQFKVSGLRWWIIGLVFVITVINYLDRLTISVLAPVITQDLGLSNTEFGSITTWFLLAYTISQGVSGKLYDRLGNKLGFCISVVIWSVAACLHAFATGIGSLSFDLSLVLAKQEIFPVRQKFQRNGFRKNNVHWHKAFLIRAWQSARLLLRRLLLPYN